MGSAVFGTAAASGAAAASGRTAGGVSRRDAREIARDAVDHLGNKDEFHDWRRQAVKRPQLFHAKIQSDDGQSVTYEPRAWVFPIQNRGEDVGFITIDAQQTESPVLAYGRGTPPQRRASEAVDVAKRVGRTPKQRFLYHGGVQYGLETDAGMMVDLRGRAVTPRRPAPSTGSLTPPGHAQGNGRNETQPDSRPRDERDEGGSSVLSAGKNNGDDGASEWNGPTDAEVSGVPNWTSSDDGGAWNTSVGSGDDEWEDWDGCVPIAMSMAVGYHEGLGEGPADVDEREEIIDEIHRRVNTSTDGVTDYWDFDKLDGYTASDHTYGADTKRVNLPNHVHWAVDHDEPPMLTMDDGPYTSGDVGHAVTVVGYEHDTGLLRDTDHNYKVHTGYSDPPNDNADADWYTHNPPEHINHGNWVNARVLQIWTK